MAGEQLRSDCTPHSLPPSAPNENDPCGKAAFSSLLGSMDRSGCNHYCSVSHGASVLGEMGCRVRLGEPTSGAIVRSFQSQASDLTAYLDATLPARLLRSRPSHPYHRFPTHEYCHATCRFW